MFQCVAWSQNHFQAYTHLKLRTLHHLRSSPAERHMFISELCAACYRDNQALSIFHCRVIVSSFHCRVWLSLSSTTSHLHPDNAPRDDHPNLRQSSPRASGTLITSSFCAQSTQGEGSCSQEPSRLSISPEGPPVRYEPPDVDTHPIGESQRGLSRFVGGWQVKEWSARWGLACLRLLGIYPPPRVLKIPSPFHTLHLPQSLL